MQEINVALKPMNIGQLETAIREEFGARYLGMSTDQKRARLFVEDDFEMRDTEILIAIYEAHTPEETDEQAERRKRNAKKQHHQLLRQFKKADIRTIEDALPFLEAVIKLIAQDD